MDWCIRADRVHVTSLCHWVFGSWTCPRNGVNHMSYVDHDHEDMRRISV